MNTVLDRIDAWQSTGLIDASTADRLRAAEASTTETTTSDEPSGDRARSAASVASSFFGPTPTIVEVFAYLGAGFFLGAWSAFVVRLAGTGATGGTGGEGIMTAGSWLASAVLFGLGLFLRGGDARRQRGAGVAILVATMGGALGMDFLGRLLHVDSGPLQQLLDAVAAVAVAWAGRRLLPSVTTQVALLGAVTAFGAAILAYLEPMISAAPASIDFSQQQPADSILVRVVLPAIAWLVVAFAIGLVGLAEARSTDDLGRRRATVTRFWAGILAVLGLATSAFRSGSLGDGTYDRLVEPWVADVVVIVLAAILLERALRRDSAAFMIAAAIGLVTALTDFNFSYLSESRDVGLVIEGVILLGVGFAADRLRRRIGSPGSERTPVPVPADVPQA